MRTQGVCEALHTAPGPREHRFPCHPPAVLPEALRAPRRPRQHGPRAWGARPCGGHVTLACDPPAWRTRSGSRAAARLRTPPCPPRQPALQFPARLPARPVAGVLASGGAGGLAPGAAQAGADTVSPPRRPCLPSASLAARSLAAHPPLPAPSPQVTCALSLHAPKSAPHLKRRVSSTLVALSPHST